jgi:cysteine-rich repeat protein
MDTDTSAVLINSTCASTVANGSPLSVCAPTSGDGLIKGGEECDDANGAGSDGCSALCAVEANYTCSGAPSVCVYLLCGNGVSEGTEECDDSNSAGGDGCSATCAMEAGHSRSGAPSNCSNP